MSQPHLYPVASRAVARADREARAGHRGGVYWLTGLSGAGKSTVALRAERELFAAGANVRLLDGDDVRTGLCADLGFSLDDRRENIRRVACVARLFCESGAVVLCSFVSPTRAVRELAREIVGPDDFHEVHVAADLATCEARDVKGLYARARAGEIRGFTGVDSPYEPPEHPALRLDTSGESAEASAKTLLDFVRTRSALPAQPPRP